MTVVEQLASEYEDKYTKLKEQLNEPMTELAELEEVLERLDRVNKAPSLRNLRKRIDSDMVMAVLSATKDPLRAGEIQKRAKVRINPSTMSQQLKAMEKAGLIIREGSGAGSRYKIAHN